MLNAYYRLAKPGIIFGNCLTTIAGFFLASRGHISLWLLITTVIGIGLVIAGDCVLNNYIDRDIDVKMERTKHRASVTGQISPKAMLVYAVILLIIGFYMLIVYTNPLTVVLAAIGVITYLILYTPSKRVTVYSTLIGSISGAMPPLVGYCAVTGKLDLAAFILCGVIILWQMPHFYAIAMYKKVDYAAASIPILPIKKGSLVAKIHILIYIVAFIFFEILLTVFGFMGYVYMILMLIVGLIWFLLALQGFRSTTPEVKWAENTFRFSLYTILIFCISLLFTGFI